MTDTVCLTIDWREADRDIPDTQQEVITQALFRDLRLLDMVETVGRIPDPNVPVGGMGAHWLWSILTAEIPGGALGVACQEAFSRLPGKPMALTIEVNGQSQKIDAQNVLPGDFDDVIDKLVAAAQKMKAAEVD